MVRRGGGEKPGERRGGGTSAELEQSLDPELLVGEGQRSEVNQHLLLLAVLGLIVSAYDGALAAVEKNLLRCLLGQLVHQSKHGVAPCADKGGGIGRSVLSKADGGGGGSLRLSTPIVSMSDPSTRGTTWLSSNMYSNLNSSLLVFFVHSWEKWGEWRVESREQRAESREQRVESRELRAESREQRDHDVGEEKEVAKLEALTDKIGTHIELALHDIRTWRLQEQVLHPISGVSLPFLWLLWFFGEEQRASTR